MAYLISKLTNYTIPLTRGTDVQFAVQRVDTTTGDPVDWDASVYMLLDIDKITPTQVDADVEGNVATITIESETADLCKSSTTWRVVMSVDGTPTLEKPLLVGVFERNDGR